jgi:hypothetical protein
MASELGVCPVATAWKYDGLNGGRAAGRICWQVCQSEGPDRRLGDLAPSTPPSCRKCAFYKRLIFDTPESQPAVRELTPVRSTAETA